MVNPAEVIGADVVPSWFELIADGPHEVTLNILVEDGHDALTETHDLVVSVEDGVDSALAILDGRLLEVETSLSVWAKRICCAVKVDGVLIQVRVWALDALAIARWTSVGVVETAEPGGANVGSEGPLSNPDVVLDVVGLADVGTVFIAIFANVTMGSTPGEILMSVHDDVLHIIVLEQIVPHVGIEMESVVEDELDTGLLLLDHCSHVSIEFLEDIQVGAPPWLVDWLDGIESGMVTPLGQEALNGIFSEIDVLLVDAEQTAAIIRVDGSEPLAPSVRPVIEVVLVGPGRIVAETRVVKAVLGANDGVHVQKHLNVVLLCGVEEPLDLVGGTVSAANVGAVGLEGPVTDWDSDDLNISSGHLDESVLSDPLFPMLTEHGVSLLGSKSIAEGVLIHTDTLGMSLAEESVEERWGDPWLEDLPATNVGADEGFLAILGEGSGGEGRDSEGLH